MNKVLFRIKFLFACLGLFLLHACTGQKEISFVSGRNFYFSNEAPPIRSLRYTTLAEFERYFGYSPVMGTDGEPTPIDFQKQMVIAKVLPQTDTLTTITAQKLVRTPDGKLHLYYHVQRKGGKQSYSIRPFLLMVVDGKYRNSTIVEHPVLSYVP